MTDEDVTKFRSVVKEEIDSALEPVKDRFSNMEGHFNDPKTGLKRINQKLDALWDQTVRLTEGFEEIKESLKSQTTILSHTDDNLEKVDKRLNKVEDHLGVVPPSELTIAG